VSQSRHPQATFIRLRRPSRAFARFESDLSSETTESASTLTAAQQTAHARLRPIVDTFNAPIDWAVAYGSGVVHQANASPGVRLTLQSRLVLTFTSQLPPLTDFLFSTPSPASFHTTNLGQNPSHYPLYARLLGGRALGWLQETWGAGVWYVTMVKIHGIVRGTCRSAIDHADRWSSNCRK